MTLALLVTALLQGASAAAPPPPAPASPLLKPPIVATVSAPRRGGLLFVAPSGEPFRADRTEAYPVVVWFARADANHDGQLTRSEFRRDFMTFFAKLDANGDGIIDSSEINRYEQDIVPEVRVGFGSGPEFRQLSNASSPEGGDGGGEEAPAQSSRPLPDLPRGGGRYSLINAPEPVVSMDTDLNRRITQQEFVAAADRRFTLLDPNERGYLTLDGLPKTPIQGRAEGRTKRK